MYNIYSILIYNTNTIFRFVPIDFKLITWLLEFQDRNRNSKYNSEIQISM